MQYFDRTASAAKSPIGASPERSTGGVPPRGKTSDTVPTITSSFAASAARYSATSAGVAGFGGNDCERGLRHEIDARPDRCTGDGIEADDGARIHLPGVRHLHDRPAQDQGCELLVGVPAEDGIGTGEGVREVDERAGGRAVDIGVPTFTPPHSSMTNSDASIDSRN